MNPGARAVLVLVDLFLTDPCPAFGPKMLIDVG